ncbi:BLUF domain-containing protein [Azospirillum sp.]|uniref:BLUF domain-containing protein n=1 Tax=Azospirillum sp. TaxID=34012 RepID=UPI002D3DDBA4|nr:BLUF domain-containing protein [Azospirillum sp.]HYD65413.1 BLUF domain-containing protein [Azospirillum sp.]
MLTLVYRSEMTQSLSANRLAELCLLSARKNQRLGVTGFLVHFHGIFLQILEGPADVVETLFATIAADERHRNVDVLMRDDSEGKRNFAFWSMNLGPLDDAGFRARVLQGDMSGQEFAARTRDPDGALDLLMRAYTEACILSHVDPAAHDLTSGTIPAWILPTHMAQHAQP